MEPPIKKSLGADWDKLGKSIQKHYNISGNNPQTLIVQGEMERIFLSPQAKIMAFFLRPIQALVPYEGKNIPTVLTNYTKADDQNMYWNREFDFTKINKDKVIFSSRMKYHKDHEIIEFLKLGLGGIATLSVEDNGTLVYEIKNYTLNVLGIFLLKIPSILGLGKGTIKEIPLGPNKFRVEFETTHQIFGQMFGYEGDFEIVE